MRLKYSRNNRASSDCQSHTVISSNIMVNLNSGYFAGNNNGSYGEYIHWFWTADQWNVEDVRGTESADPHAGE